MTNLNDASQPRPARSPLDSAIFKASVRLLPLLFVCYIIAYIDRVNVSLAKLKMVEELKGFDDAVIGFGAGIFFIGYFLLEIPGTVLVEKWSARKWIFRIMVTWGLIAAATGFVHYKIPVITDLAVWFTHALFWVFSIFLVPLTLIPGGLSTWASGTITSLRSEVQFDVAQFYSIRFLLGLAEAGFFPGAIVYMTHWFPAKSRSRALSWFLIGTPAAQIISPKISNLILKIGTTETLTDGTVIQHAQLMGLNGWQWLYVFWGIPAVILGVVVLLYLHDRPRHAPWLTTEEKEALEGALEEERAHARKHHHMTFIEALYHPKVLLLALAYCLIVTGNYGVDFFLPTILKEWYSLNMNSVTWLLLLPAMAALVSIMVVGFSSDHFKERRWHAAIPGLLGGVAFILVPHTKGNIYLTVGCFMIICAGVKAYLPPFWCLPSLFLTEVAAAGSIGLINSVGNLGGYFGPAVVGWVRTKTNSFNAGLYFLGISLILYCVVILAMRFDHKPKEEEEGLDVVRSDAVPESA